MTAPLPGAPIVFTPAMRAADDAYRDERHARAQQDRNDVDDWVEAARERVHGRLDAWLTGLASDHGRST